MEKYKSGFILGVIMVVGLSFLLFFKYIDFFIQNLNILGNAIGGGSFLLATVNPIAPIGISFFTFQATGYLIDVYRGKVNAEKNLLRYAAYVSFFPVITSGPIERANTLLEEIRNSKAKLSYYNMQKGIILFVYGAFVKLVISNRLAVLVDTVFNNYLSFGGAVLILITVAYTFEIYCDFFSYSLLASGVAKCLGIEIIENFKAPYFAETIQEFWRRWHISLSTWFRDYIYISLGGNRCSKFRKNANVFITFVISGMWHGANWTFIVWGGLHGIYQVIANLTEAIRKRIVDYLGIDRTCFSFHFWKKLFVFLCVSFAWIFFRANSILDAFHYIVIMVTDIRVWQLFDGTLYQLGLSNLQFDLLCIFLLFMLVIDYKKYKTDRNIDSLLLNQDMAFRCIFIAGLLIITLVFGFYGPGINTKDFIYFNF